MNPARNLMPLTLAGCACTVSLVGCIPIPYPIYKTLQPEARVLVLDQNERPIAGAQVTLPGPIPRHLSKAAKPNSATRKVSRALPVARNGKLKLSFYTALSTTTGTGVSRTRTTQALKAGEAAKSLNPT